MRITGGLSAVLLVTGRLEKLGLGILYPFFLYICFILTFLFLFYSFYVNYYRIKYMFKVLKSDELDVRNSPLDRFASISARLL